MGVLLIGAVIGGLAFAAEDTGSDFGTSGLIKTPNARMAEDSTLRATIAFDEVANLHNLTFQALPKVQATFRYTIFNPRGVEASTDDLRDRSYEVKAQVLGESRLLPQVAVGARDILGTGAWEAEYVAASKRWENFDFTLGIGWGRLGSRASFSNPLRVLGGRFEERPDRLEVSGPQAGTSRGASFFKGEASFFGGVALKIPDTNLTFLAEYESDRYVRETNLGTLKNPSAFNFALSWHPFPSTSLRLSWLRGNTFGLALSSQIEAKRASPRKYSRSNSSVDLDETTGLPEGYNPSSWYDRMLFESERGGVDLRRSDLRKGQKKASLVIENRSYNLTADALNHVMTMSEIYSPRHVTSLDLLIQENGQVGPTINYSLNKGQNVEDGRSELRSRIKILAPRELTKVSNRTDYGYPKLGLGIDLAAKVQLMDPDDPLRKQIFAKLTAKAELSEHVNIFVRYEQDLFNDFTTERNASSALPQVKTLVNNYLVNGASGLEQLYIEDKRSLGSSVHSWVYAGILETMYGGVGGELLFSPYMQRWALGFGLNGVKQRGFERDFQFRDYETISAFVSGFYASPFYDVDFALHVGRYLAGDKGYTFEARRSFDNGFSIGGFFTRTNVSAQEFGEGSFDKGLFFRIPFDGFLPGNTRSSYSTVLRPLERDGGRRLENFGGALWFDRRSFRYDVLDRNISRMVPR